MANAVSVTRQTSVSLEQRSESARSILGQRITSTQALKLAKDLVGSFPNLRPDNPSRFIESVAQVLERYPVGIGMECADPSRGLAAKVEFLSIKVLVDWCEARLSFYRSIAAYVRPPAPRQIEPGPISAEQCQNLMAKVAEVLRANTKPSPLDNLIKQVSDARRLRIEEIIRTADAPCRADEEPA